MRARQLRLAFPPPELPSAENGMMKKPVQQHRILKHADPDLQLMRKALRQQWLARPLMKKVKDDP